MSGMVGVSGTRAKHPTGSHRGALPPVSTVSGDHGDPSLGFVSSDKMKVGVR